MHKNFIKSFEKVAQQGTQWNIDKKKAADFQKGFNNPISMGQAWSNLKSGLGMGGQAPGQYTNVAAR